MLIVSKDLEKALICLRYLWLNKPTPIGPKELSKQTELPIKFVSQLLESFKRADYVDQCKDHLFRLKNLKGVNLRQFASVIGDEFFHSKRYLKNVIPIHTDWVFSPIEKLKSHIFEFSEKIYLEPLLEECSWCQCHGAVPLWNQSRQAVIKNGRSFPCI